MREAPKHRNIGGRGRTLESSDNTIVYTKVRANKPPLSGKDNNSVFPHSFSTTW
jgi:hypothetical protein